MEKIKINFTSWILKGHEGSKPGYKRVLNPWLILHVCIGLLLSCLIETPIQKVSQTILLPMMGVLIGLTFAWAGNAQGFIQSQEIITLSKNKPGGYIDYIFTYQLSILIVLICSGLWGLAAIDFKEIGIGDQSVHLKYLPETAKLIIKSVLYFILSLAIHESWSVIKGVHYFLIVRNKVYEVSERQKENKKK